VNETKTLRREGASVLVHLQRAQEDVVRPEFRDEALEDHAGRSRARLGVRCPPLALEP
jgi:hypothetical protein